MVALYDNVAKYYACMEVNMIMEVHPVRPFYITIVIFSEVDVHLSKYQKSVK